MEGVIKGHTFCSCVPSYWLPVMALGSEPSEAVKAVPDFLLMIACGPCLGGDIVMLSMGVGEVGTKGGTLYSPRDGRCRPVQ